jgi:hypothetical protein
MKLHVLMMAVALAAGSALAQAPAGSEKSPADTATMAPSTDKAPVHKKKVSKKKAKHHAHAKAHHSTQSMGAGAASPSTDLEAKARQDRMDQAYANWQGKR